MYSWTYIFPKIYDDNIEVYIAVERCTFAGDINGAVVTSRFLRCMRFSLKDAAEKDFGGKRVIKRAHEPLITALIMQILRQILRRILRHILRQILRRQR